MDQILKKISLKKRSRATVKNTSSQMNHDETAQNILAAFERVRKILQSIDYSIYICGAAHQKYAAVLDAEDFLFSDENRLWYFLDQTHQLFELLQKLGSEAGLEKIKKELEYFYILETYILTLMDCDTRESPLSIFIAAGISKPEISTFSEEFLLQMQSMPRRHIALALLKKIISDELAIKKTKNIVQYKRFSRTLRNTYKRYKNHMLTIDESIVMYMHLIREIRECNKRASVLSISEEEMAIYDILTENKNMEKMLGSDVLKDLAKVLAKRSREGPVDGDIVRESDSRKIYLRCKQILMQYSYPETLCKKVITNIINNSKLYENKRFAKS